jgi:hypothetical protein
MSDELSGFETNANPRPTFLTVLCILTFIFSAYSIITNSFGYVSADTKAAAVKIGFDKAKTDMQKDTSNNEGKAFAQKIVTKVGDVLTPENIRKSSLGSIIAAIFCLLGALMMFKLKKIGYYIYLLGTLIGIAAPFIIYGGTNLLAIASSLVIGFIGIVFCIMYGVNLKEMK